MFYTYAHYKTGTGEIFYIGKGKGNRYKSKDCRKNEYWKRIVNKYGMTAEILAYWKTEKEALDHEKLLISSFRDMGYKLTNLTNGGEGLSGLKFSEEHKHKLKIARQGKKPNLGNKHSKETKLLLSAKKIGNKISVGRKLSEETKSKMSLSAKKRWHKNEV